MLNLDINYLIIIFKFCSLEFCGAPLKTQLTWLFQRTQFPRFYYNGTVHIRHLCWKTAVLSCHRCQHTGVEKMNCIEI